MCLKKLGKIKIQVTVFTSGIFFVCVCSALILSQPASAHPPSNIVLQYDTSIQTLGVTISHNVVDPEEHYIYRVEIKKNGQTYKTLTYIDQPNDSSFTYTYQVNATKGDSFEVTASCNLGGSLTKQLTVGSETGQNGENKSTPGFEIILVLCAVMVMLLLYQRRKMT